MSGIAIVGGGMVGLSAALALAGCAREVAIVEAGKPREMEASGFNARSIALSTSSVQIFRALGVWDAIAAQAAPIEHIHISARGRWGVTRLHARDYELDALGYVIESHALGRCLLEAVDAMAGIELFDAARFEAIAQHDGVEIAFRRKRKRMTLEPEFAVIADGAESPARAALGIDHRVVDYAQTVIVCNVEVGAARTRDAFERFTPQGPLAMLPLGGRRYACVWTLRPAAAESIAALDEGAFCAALEDAFGFRLGGIERAGERFALPLRRVQADALAAGRCVLLGNAANALHPVAGQSFNLSLRDIASLYELLVERPLETLDDAGIEQLGADYATARAAEHARVIRYGDGLVTLFSNPLPLLDPTRAAALGLLDLLPALKAQVAFTGMGLAFGGNRLLRGHP